jgi:negative elongation factor C/D
LDDTYDWGRDRDMSHLPSPSSSTSFELQSSTEGPSVAYTEDGREDSDESMIEKCVGQFRQKDGIMETAILSLTKKFLSAGGTPPTVVQLLSENYRGYAEMSNLLCKWLIATGLNSEEVSSILKSQLKALIIQKFDPVQADSIFGEMQAAPEWLDQMIQHVEWRSLIYQLSEVYPNCLMLNFAIQRISDAGHQTEIASLATASTNFGVFNRVLMHSLQNILTYHQDTLPPKLSDFKKMCCHSEHTYLYAQAVICRLMHEPNGHRLKRLSQELQAAALEHGQIGRRIGLLTHREMYRWLAVGEAIHSILSSRATSPGDILKLHKEYSKPDPPPAEILRHPELFELLIKDLFSPQKAINASHISKYIYVLAYAACIDRPGREGRRGREELAHTIQALNVVQPICHANSFGSELQVAVQDIRLNLVYPVVAAGVLQWIRVNMTDASYYTATVNTLRMPIYFDLLREISYRHPFQREIILNLLTDCFSIDYELDALATVEFKKELLGIMLYLMKCGFVMPVLDYIAQCTGHIDQSLIRHFITQLVEMIQPPYSPEFVASVLRVIAANVDAFRAATWEAAADLPLFINECLAKQEDLLSLSARETLATLQAVFVDGGTK